MRPLHSHAHDYAHGHGPRRPVCFCPGPDDLVSKRSRVPKPQKITSAVGDVRS